MFFWYEAHVGLVYLSMVTIIVMYIEDIPCDVYANNGLVQLVENGWRAIWARGCHIIKSVGFYVNFLRVERFIQVLLHLVIQSLLKIVEDIILIVSVLSRDELVFEKIDEYRLNFLFFIGRCSFIISDRFESVLVLPLSGFTMKIFCIGVSLLQLMDFGSLGPPNLLLVQNNVNLILQVLNNGHVLVVIVVILSLMDMFIQKVKLSLNMTKSLFPLRTKVIEDILDIP